MKTDTEIKIEGTKALIKAMGTVEAERYIALIARERFDYTVWRLSILPEGRKEVLKKLVRQQCNIEKIGRQMSDKAIRLDDYFQYTPPEVSK